MSSVKETNVSRLHRPFFRNGPEHRSGADVSFQDVVKVFGFRTVTIGKWVTKEEQQIAANLVFDALSDLMDILQIPEQVISLNGTLSLAFGSGGQKDSSAHYNPHKKQLALAKNAGGGALAHEWFHSFDHYIASRMFRNCGPLSFASQLWLEDASLQPHTLNERMSMCFEKTFLSDNKQDPNDYVLRSARADKALKMYYYAQPQEMAARCFEAVIQDQPQKNAFLVQGTKQSQEVKLGLYPENQHRQNLSDCYLDYFKHLGRALTANRK